MLTLEEIVRSEQTYMQIFRPVKISIVVVDNVHVTQFLRDQNLLF